MGKRLHRQIAANHAVCITIYMHLSKLSNFDEISANVAVIPFIQNRTQRNSLN